MLNIKGLLIKNVKVNYNTKIVEFEVQNGAYFLQWREEEYTITKLYYIDGNIMIEYRNENEADSINIENQNVKVFDDVEEKEIDKKVVSKKLQCISKIYLEIL